MEVERTLFRKYVVHSLNDLKSRCNYLFSHCLNVSNITVSIGKRLDNGQVELNALELAGILHDIGKTRICSEILNKTGELTSDEWQTIKRHPEIGYVMLVNIEGMSKIAEGILFHHEQYDGSGYPLGLKGGQIPLFSRIIAVADAYDAMTANRPYRKKMTSKAAIEELIRCSGRQFDPEIVKVFLQAYNNHEIMYTM
ncbi:HD-GYP domain-containing protein [Mobilitalea sibirica]|uniref:HD-GYP domain-containing protein n=1 Tax=Mobilitalea sibirica TaxID=1462919 RepID=A0A8J7GXH8_9FIRM|nr:HD-GYP domain-containing protein [Mobilitalea sibirica]MBH1939909.1 HD-GYP domain-containing protein [Mobilitalea sibirica]